MQLLHVNGRSISNEMIIFKKVSLVRGEGRNQFIENNEGAWRLKDGQEIGRYSVRDHQLENDAPMFLR